MCAAEVFSGRSLGGVTGGIFRCELLSCWCCDGVLLWVWFVTVRRSLVPLSLLKTAASDDGVNKITCRD